MLDTAVIQSIGDFFQRKLVVDQQFFHSFNFLKDEIFFDRQTFYRRKKSTQGGIVFPELYSKVMAEIFVPLLQFISVDQGNNRRLDLFYPLGTFIFQQFKSIGVKDGPDFIRIGDVVCGNYTFSQLNIQHLVSQGFHFFPNHTNTAITNHVFDP